jgi:hypothetical protein
MIKMNTIDYTYIGKPRSIIISELFANDLKSISKLPKELFDLELNKFVNPQEIAIKNLSENKDSLIDNEIIKDNNRVLNNLLNIPLNTTVRIDYSTLVKKVPNGWIYYYEIYNDNINPSVINMIATFVKYN